MAKGRELRAWCKFEVFLPVEGGAPSKAAANCQRVLARRMVGGKRDAKARLAAKGRQGPDLKAGLAETSACVSLRSSHLRVASMSALRKWKPRGPDIRNAAPQADGLNWGVWLRATPERDP